MKKDTTRSELKSLLVKRSLILGPVTLSNGSKSNHYFDCKKVTLSSDGAELVGNAILDVIEDLPAAVQAIGGLTHGADPIIGAVMMCARMRGLRLDGFYVRKEPKQHGTKSLVENAPPPGANVVVVDDVVTAGGSVIKAIDAADQAGCHVVAVITIVDRLEGGTERIKAKVENYRPLFTLDDFRSEIECQNTSKSELFSAGVSR